MVFKRNRRSFLGVLCCTMFCSASYWTCTMCYVICMLVAQKYTSSLIYVHVFVLIYILVSVFGCSGVSDSLQPHGLQPARLLCPWDSPGKNPGVGCHALLQGIFPTQGSNPGLLGCRQILYQLSSEGSPIDSQ